MLATDLGRMPYVEALQIQRQTHEAVSSGSAPATLLLVEHDAVITTGRRASLRGQVTRNLLLDRDQLQQLGIDLQESDRGGDVTYHGPGQLVVYPILKLASVKLGVTSYIRLLEQAVIDTLAGFGVKGAREQGAVGVWVATKDRPASKICAMGVRIRRNTSMHGLALNVRPDMSHFKTIVPCGLVGRDVTSLQQLLGDAVPEMSQVKAALVDALRSHLAASADRDELDV